MVMLDYRAIYRNLVDHKLYNIVNIVGLIIGIVAGGVLFLYILDQYSYDSTVRPGGPIYRINTHVTMGEVEFKTATGPAPLAAALRAEIPEVTTTTRVMNDDRLVVKVGDQEFLEPKFYFAEPSLFSLFAFEFLYGDPKTSLEKPSSLVLTESVVAKYMDPATALNKQVEIEGRPWTITGIIRDPPENSHLVPRGLLSLSTLGTDRDSVWASLNDFTYLRTVPTASRSDVEDKLPNLVDKYAKDVYARFKARVEFSLQPVDRIHFGEKLRYELDPSKLGSRTDIYLATFVAILMVVLASANYAILSIAISLRRAREIGIRKVVGADRPQILAQCLLEGVFLISSIAVVSMLLLWPVVHIFNDAFGTSIAYSALFNWRFLLALAGICFSIALIGGAYPALYLASFEPVNVLKDQAGSAHGSMPVKGVLLVVQLCLVMFMVASTWVAISQFHFLRDTDLGFDTHNLVKLPLSNGQVPAAYEGLKRAFMTQPGVAGFSSATATPGGTGFISNSFELEQETGGTNIRVLKNFATDDQFDKVSGLQIVAGRFFNSQVLTDDSAIVVNETLVRELGWHNPIGKRMDKIVSQNMDKKTFHVVGVVRDFHVQSLHDKIEPVAMTWQAANPIALLKLSDSAALSVEGSLKPIWDRFIRERPFDAKFVAQDFEEQYQAEKHKGDVLLLFTIFAVLIAFIGVFGIASYVIAQSAKELAIRTVIGASRSELAVMICKGFAKALVLAGVIALPVAWHFMNQYLSNFAYHIDLGATPFLAAFACVLFVMALTISQHILVAIHRNPIESLRAE